MLIIFKLGLLPLALSLKEMRMDIDAQCINISKTNIKMPLMLQLK